jgi:predicted amidohydrolase
MTAPRFTAACVQMRSTRDPLRNRDDAVRLIREAAAAGANFVQTPEVTNLCERDTKRLREISQGEEQHEVLADCGKRRVKPRSGCRSARSRSGPARRSPTVPI